MPEIVLILLMNMNNIIQPYALGKIFWAGVIGSIQRKFKINKNQLIPLIVGDYRFVSLIKKVGPKKSYRLALYKNNNGEKAFAKLRSSMIKDYHYYSLLNEIAVNKILTQVYDRIKRTLPNKYLHIRFPRFLYACEANGWLVELMEYVTAKDTNNFRDEQKVTTFVLVSDFLGYLGKHFTIEERKQISRRTTLNLISLYPFILLKTLINYPYLVIKIIKATVLFISSIPDLKKTRQEQLIHRDLHFFNILQDKKTLVVIDLQQCVFGEVLQEYVTTLRYFWGEGRFYKLFFQETLKRFENRKNYIKILRGLMINSVIHGLTDKSFSKKAISNWFDYLDFAINPNFKLYENKGHK